MQLAVTFIFLIVVSVSQCSTIYQSLLYSKHLIHAYILSELVVSNLITFPLILAFYLTRVETRGN